MLKLISFIFLICVSGSLFSQVWPDSVQTLLIKDTIPVPLRTIQRIPPNDQFNTKPFMPDDGSFAFEQSIRNLNGTIFQCGTSFHENGDTSSIVLCSNGKLHGKTTLLDKKNRLRIEKFFNYGCLYKEITYVRGKVYYIANLRRSKDGIDKKHGENILHRSPSTKTVERYNMGILHGITTYYDQGDKRMEKKYVNGKLKWHKRWKFGRLKLEVHYDSQDRETSRKTWNDYGELILQRNYIDGKRTGTWIKFVHHSQRQTKTVYTNDIEISSREVIIHSDTSETLLSKSNRTPEGLTNYVHYYENGSKSMEMIGKDALQHYIEWDEYGNEKSNYRLHKTNYLGNGYKWVDESTTHQYSTTEDTMFIFPMVRWTISYGDTIAQEYLSRSYYPEPEILITNHYKQSANKGYVKEGVCYNYNGNYIEDVCTYRLGILHGRFISYYHNGGNPTIKSTGEYRYGLKTGTWAQYLRSGEVEEVQFINGIKQD